MRHRRSHRKEGFQLNGKTLKPETLMLNYGYKPSLSEGSLKCPIFQTSTFVFKNAEEGKHFFQSAYGLPGASPKDSEGLIYSRLNNPDLEILEDRLSVWDDADAAAVFPSGMAAIATTLLEFLRPGDFILHSQPLYGGTHHFIEKFLSLHGIRSLGVRAGTTYGEVENLLQNSDTHGRLGMIFLETPANPTNEMVDLSVFVAIAKKYSTPDRKVLVAVDNTFLGPLWQQPIKHGADLILYSATKFIGGHSDVIAGVCLGSSDNIHRIKGLRTFLGTVPDPWTGWLLLRSLETLKIRMKAQSEGASHVAHYLVQHKNVEKVYFPGLLKESDAQFSIFRRQCSGPGSMISFDVKGGEKEAFVVLNALKIIHLAVSLGGTESLAEHPASMTHADVSSEEKARFGISDKMIRLSVGVEDPDDLIADLDQALSKI